MTLLHYTSDKSYPEPASQVLAVRSLAQTLNA